MLRKTVVFLLFVSALGKKPLWHQLDGYTFEKYLEDFGKKYDATYTVIRKKHFEDNIKMIRKLNSDPTMTWKAGVNMFTDLSTAEFKSYNKLRAPAVPYTDDDYMKIHRGPAANETLPKAVDWRRVWPRIVTPVKHQGACGNCWAQSAAETMESQYAKLTGKLAVLSVAQISSCTPQCDGCQGGEQGAGWRHLMDMAKNQSAPAVQQSLTEEWAYPVPITDFFADDHGWTTSPCKDISKQWQTPATAWFAELTAVGVKGVGQVKCNSDQGGPAAMKAINDVGPLSVDVAAGNWQWYESGIFQNTNKSGIDAEWGIDHAVQMVGYGWDEQTKANFWLVRNSWSTLWGEDGYIRLWRASGSEPEPCSPDGTSCGTSGVLCNANYPIVYAAPPIKFG